MERYECRLAKSSDVAALYDLLNEYVTEKDLEGEFSNSKQSKYSLVTKLVL